MKSTIQHRLGFMQEVKTSTETVLDAFSAMNIHTHDHPELPRKDVLVAPHQAKIIPVSINISHELRAMGIPKSTAVDLSLSFQRLVEPLHSTAWADLSQMCQKVQSIPSSSENRDVEALIQKLVSTAQHTYELEIEELKATFLDEAVRRSRSTRLGATPPFQRDINTDEDSDDDDAPADDTDSDSEEAVNIERYYPILEEMFLRGVVRPSRHEKLKLSEHTRIPYYNLGIWFQNRRDRGPHAGKGEWMQKYTESRSITPASHASTTDGAETDGSVSDHGMSEFDEDEWETDPEDVPDLNLLELGPSARHLLALPTVRSMPASSMTNASEFDSIPPTPFTSSSRSISFESSSDSFSYSEASFVSAGPSMYTGSPSPLLEPDALLPSLVSHIQVPSESQTRESSLLFGLLPTPTPSMSFSSSFSPSFSFSAPLSQSEAPTQMRSNTPSTAPGTPDEGPNTPPASSFAFDFGPTVPFGNSSRSNMPIPNFRTSPAINDASPPQGGPQTPPATFRSFNFEFSLTPSPTHEKFNDIDLSFGSFDIAPFSSAVSFFDSFNTNQESPYSSDSASDYASPESQGSGPPSRTASPPPPRSILLDFSGINENDWRPGPTPEPSEVGSQEDAVELKLLAAAASVASRNPGQQSHNPSPFKLVLYHPISPRPESPLMEPLFPLSSPLRDPSPIPSPSSPVMGMLPFLNHAVRPPPRVDELAFYANMRVEKSPSPVPLVAERLGLDEPSPLALTRHPELEPAPKPQLSLLDVLKEPPVPVVDRGTRDRVNDFLKRYCTGRNESRDEDQAKLFSLPPTPHFPTTSALPAVPQDIEAM